MAKGLNGFDGKSQPLALPTGADEQNAKRVLRNREASPSLLTGNAGDAGSDSIGNDVDLFRWKIVPVNDFLGDHAGICDRRPYSLENLPLQGEKCGVFQIQEPKPALPARFKARSSLQPRGVNAVSRAIYVATRNTIETEDGLPRFARSLESSGKFQRLAGVQTDELAIRPVIFRPVVGGVECWPVAARVQTGCETEQVSFGPAAFGISPPDETDVGSAGRCDHCERNFLC